jgi:hypothetical protein
LKRRVLCGPDNDETTDITTCVVIRDVPHQFQESRESEIYTASEFVQNDSNKAGSDRFHSFLQHTPSTDACSSGTARSLGSHLHTQPTETLGKLAGVLLILEMALWAEVHYLVRYDPIRLRYSIPRMWLSFKAILPVEEKAHGN